jgi:DNA-binding CsgD family transcriptional regulator
MQMSNNAAQRKNKYGTQNLRDLSEHFNPEPSRVTEVEGTQRKNNAERNGRAHTACAGFLLLDTSFRPMYANQEALAALTYPANPCKNDSFDGFLEDRLQTLFVGSNGSRQLKSQGTLASGRRCYQLRMFSVTSPLANGFKPAVAIILERNHKHKVDLSSLSGRFRLTQREIETVDHLVQGFNTEQIADRMGISPNTVKAFLRSVMMKMGTDSRAGIIGKILQASNSITRETSS